MALISLPSNVRFEAVDTIQLLRAGTSLRSRYTGKRQAVSFPFAVWVFEGKLIPMEGLDAGEWRAFLVALEGEQNTFQLPVPGVSKPLSNYSGTAVVTTASGAARAKSLAVSGTASARVAEVGDFFTINGELKVATAACVLNGSGAGTLAFEPGLRNVAASASSIILNNPYCVMSAQDSEQAKWSLRRPVQHGISLKAIEAF